MIETTAPREDRCWLVEFQILQSYHLSRWPLRYKASRQGCFVALQMRWFLARGRLADPRSQRHQSNQQNKEKRNSPEGWECELFFNRENYLLSTLGNQDSAEVSATRTGLY